MCLEQNEEELQFAVGGAVADVACSGSLFVPAGSILEAMRASARAARRDMKEVIVGSNGEEKKAGEEKGATVDALDYVLYQVERVNQQIFAGRMGATFWRCCVNVSAGRPGGLTCFIR